MSRLIPPPSSKHVPKQQAKDSPTQRSLKPGVAQLKSVSSTTAAMRPVAPPVYRPQPVPKVLQAKMNVAYQPSASSPRAPVAPAVYRPLPTPKALQTKMAVAPQPRKDNSPRRPVAPPVYNPKVTTTGKSKPVVQPKSALPARAVIQRAEKSDFPRGNFDSRTYQAGALAHNVEHGADVDPRDPQMQQRNVALPHRVPWTFLRDRTINLVNADEDPDDFYRWTQRILDAANARFYRLGQQYHHATDDEKKQIDALMKTIGEQTYRVQQLRDHIITEARAHGDIELSDAAEFLKAINSFVPNVYGFGPHRGVNTRVQDRIHSHFEAGSATPMTRAAYEMTPNPRWPIAMTPDGTQIVGVDGTGTDPDDLSPRSRALFDAHEHARTNADTKTKWG